VTNALPIIAIIVSVVAVILTAVQNRRARKDANAAAAAADQKAIESKAVAERHAQAAEQSAQHAELTVEAMQAMVAELRRVREARPQSPPVGPSTYRDRDQLVVENGGGKHSYVLRNIGTTTLAGVTLDSEHPITRALPENETLEPGQGHPFLMAAVSGIPVPSEVKVHWADRPDGAWLPMPRK
jgi:hypothetical protein